MRPGTKAAALFVASAAVLLTAACGGGPDEATGGGIPGDGGDSGFAAYTECLRKNGVTITMPSGGPRAGASRGPRPSGSAGPRGGGFGRPAGVDDATWQKAQEACAPVRPSGRPGGGLGNGNRGGGRNAAYENCLKENGVTVTEGQPNTADPAVAEAVETCRVLRRAEPSATP